MTIRITGKKGQMKDGITLQTSRRKKRKTKRSSDHTETAKGRKRKIIDKTARKSSNMRPRIKYAQ